MFLLKVTSARNYFLSYYIALKVQSMSFLFEMENNVVLSKISKFCAFDESKNFKIYNIIYCFFKILGSIKIKFVKY